MQEVRCFTDLKWFPQSVKTFGATDCSPVTINLFKLVVARLALNLPPTRSISQFIEQEEARH